jgi:hypothetical protein
MSGFFALIGIISRWKGKEKVKCAMGFGEAEAEAYELVNAN